MKQQARIPFLIFGIVWILRCIYRFYFPNIYTDTLLLWETAENYEQLGEMVHTPIAGVHEGSSLVPLTVMPKGYVYLLWVFNHIFSTSKWSTLVMDFIAIGLWGWASLSFLKKMAPTYPYSAYLFLFYLILSPTFLHPLPTTDLLCLALLACCLSLLGTEPIERTSKQMLLVSLLLALSGWIRYAYMPFMWLFPILYGCYAFGKVGIKYAWPSLLCLLCFPMLFGIYALLHPSPLPFLNEQGKTLFWNHLTHMDLFPLKALFYFNASHLSWLADSSRLPVKFWSLLGASLSTGILLLAGYAWWNRARKGWEWWSFLFSGIFMVNVGLLVYLSLTTPPETDWLPFWTFVMETRYYAPSQYVIGLTLLYLASNSYSMWTESQER